MAQHTFEAAVEWLTRGVSLLPLQPGSKRIVPGFGPYLERITDTRAASFWFQERGCNMAVVTGHGVVALDFDDTPSYERWCKQNPNAALSLTERTRRGFHVFFVGESNTGRHVEGFEVKGRAGFVTVAPACVGGVVYSLVNHSASILELARRFSLLSEKPQLQPTRSREKPEGDDIDVIQRIKAEYKTLTLAQTVTGLNSAPNGRWWHGHCPFHEHKKTRKEGKLAFWVDSERDLWGCYACGIRGDVINLYANIHNVSIREAIYQMAAML